MSYIVSRDMKHRSRTEIVYQILSTARNEGDGAIKTKIMYGCFLSYKQMNDYLALMTVNDLLYCSPETSTYRVTKKGLRFLQVYDQIGTLMEENRIT